MSDRLYKYVPIFHCATVFRAAEESTNDGHASTNNNCTYPFLPLTAWKTCYLKRHKFMSTLRHFSHYDILGNCQYCCSPDNWANITTPSKFSVLAFIMHYITQNWCCPTCNYNTLQSGPASDVAICYTIARGTKSSSYDCQETFSLWRDCKTQAATLSAISTWLVSTAGTLGRANDCHRLILMLRCCRQ